MNILIAEDETDIRNLIRINLEENDYTVFSAQNGLEAWEIIKTQEIHLAVLDVMMPGLDGFNLLRKIRTISTLPVIFLTARMDEMDKVLGLGLGADDYLVKPFSMNELIARIGAQLRRSHQYIQLKQREPTVLQYGALSIDKEACNACKKGKPLELNAKEYKLLLFLMENPERVFTKEQLYNAVWDDNYYYDDNTIMVHISHLRNKIETDPQNPEYIKTIRGLGYKLHKAETRV